jgi:uncharacterized membrane protein
MLWPNDYFAEALGMSNNKTGFATPVAWWGSLHHPRLTLGLLVGLVVYFALTFITDMPWRMRFITAWDSGVSVALIALYIGLRDATAETMQRNAQRQDARKWAVLIISLVAATASLVVIASEMPLVKKAEGIEQAIRVVFMIFTVVLSWAFIHTVFAVHYAHDYYVDADLSKAASGAARPPLVFPGGQMPNYGDFLYFSFTVGMTFQVSDVQIADREMRRVVLAHGATSFFYTTGILALAINLVAGLI